ncbi:MAG: NAD(P)/FAD-dependent oxidoreductase [Rhodopila sp.]
MNAPVIIGGGPAGAAAAIRLAQAGHSPLLLERTEEPTDKVCGDFVGVDAIGLLQGLGVDPARLGAAPIRRLRLVYRRKMVEAPLPFPAYGVSRRVLDAALQRRAGEAGATIRTGVAVRRLERVPAGWQIDASGERLEAANVFLATGKHDLRGYPKPGVRTGAVGMKLYLRLAPAQDAVLTGATELYLFSGGYAGLQPVEAGRTVLCLAVSSASLRPWPALIAGLTEATPLLQERLTAAEPLLPRPLAVAGVPYGLLRRSTGDPALYRLGDQAAVIPSLTGDGIAIALHSGSLAAQCWLLDVDAEAYQQHLAQDLARQMRLATALHRLAMAGAAQGAALHLGRLFPQLLSRFASGTRLRPTFEMAAGLPTRGLHPA